MHNVWAVRGGLVQKTAEHTHTHTRCVMSLAHFLKTRRRAPRDVDAVTVSFDDGLAAQKADFYLSRCAEK